jgi:hypothetical protein
LLAEARITECKLGCPTCPGAEGDASEPAKAGPYLIAAE